MKVRRRAVLQGLAAALSVQSAPLSFAAAARALRRVRPGDAAWPGPEHWRELKDAVGGNLIEAHGLFEACETAPGSQACADVSTNLHNPFYLADQPGGTQVSGWLDAWTPAPSVYAVKARNSGDVAAAVNFARLHNLRLVVKGTGHSYQGTSNAPDSLLVWTHAMNKVSLHDAFVPQGCEGKTAPVPAVSAESGAVWIDLYDAVTTKAGRYVQGGGCTDVGVAGLIQSGGFGSFSKGFGTAASGLLEAEIVTADGKVRIVNSCNDQDLFWAIKGGGGGSWGVITRLTLRTHDLPQFFGAAEGTIKAASDDAYRRLIARFIAFYADALFNPHWGEQAAFTPENTLKISMVCQGLDKLLVAGVWQPFFDWVKSLPQDYTITDDFNAGAGPAQHWWDVAYRKAKGSAAMISDPRPGAPQSHAWWRGDQDQVGAFLYGYDSLWLPGTLLHKAAQPRLANALFAASRFKEFALHFNKGLAGAPADAVAAAKDTATNPEVADAFALAIVADGCGSAYPGEAGAAIDRKAARKSKNLIDLAAAELRRAAPNAGSYVSESNYFNPRWQKDYWGAHYQRLLAVKNKYDPDGLFFVHHGVGTEGWSEDGFTRIASR